MSNTVTRPGIGFFYPRYRRGFVALGVIYAIILGVFIVFHRTSILPPKFSYDGDVIKQLATGQVIIREDASYTNTAHVYEFLGLGSNSFAASLLGLGGGIALVLLCLYRARGFSAGIPEACLAALIILLSAVYIGYYSKELTVLPLTLLVLLVPSGLFFDLAIVAAMLAYSQIFREYWVIVAAVYVGLRIVNRTRARVGASIAACLAAFVVLAVVFDRVLGLPLDHFRETVNAARGAGPDAMTAIGSFTDIAQPVGGIVNAVLTFAFLLVPIPMILLGGAYYAGLAVLISGIWLFFFSSLVRVGPVLNTVSPAIETLVKRAFCFVLAFLAVQSIFEPDFGSALRHQVPLLSLVLLVCIVARGSPVDDDDPAPAHRQTSLEKTNR